jgi:serine/threonine protein kinase
MSWLRSKGEGIKTTAALDPELFLRIIQQLSNALRSLHHNGYVHRDLKV